MNELADALTQSFEDRRFTRGEQRAFRARVQEAGLDARSRAALRHAALGLVREALPGRDAERALDWLEEALRLLQPDDEERAASVAEAHFAPGDGPAHRLVGMIDDARTGIDVCVFTITDDRIAQALLRAHGHGVPVRVITDDDKAEDRGSDIRELARAGVPLRVDQSPHHMHHKFALFDERLLATGSYNWTRSAADKNQENLLVTGDPRLVTPYAELFERLWVEFAPA